MGDFLCRAHNARRRQVSALAHRPNFSEYRRGHSHDRFELLYIRAQAISTSTSAIDPFRIIGQPKRYSMFLLLPYESCGHPIRYHSCDRSIWQAAPLCVLFLLTGERERESFPQSRPTNSLAPAKY